MLNTEKKGLGWDDVIWEENVPKNVQASMDKANKATLFAKIVGYCRKGRHNKTYWQIKVTKLII